jgi:exonuclease III
MLTEFVPQLKKDLLTGCKADPDVICLQEIKASRSTSIMDFELAGYPYHYWFPATKKVIAA